MASCVARWRDCAPLVAGGYRISYRIDDEVWRIDVVHIDHRGDVYR
ncbi:MAG: type II toxin-antitoxin system RelE family toxin [Lacisediminihabitans sp.]